MLSNSSSLLATGWWAVAEPITDVSTGTGVLDALLKGGPFAVVLALIIFDKLGTNSERDRLREDNKELRATNQELNDTIRQEVVGPLAEQNRIMSQLPDVLEQVLKVLDDLDERGRRR